MHPHMAEKSQNKVGSLTSGHPVGVNIGVHSLFMAVNGVRVFAVDPLEENLLHVSSPFYV